MTEDGYFAYETKPVEFVKKPLRVKQYQFLYQWSDLSTEQYVLVTYCWLLKLRLDYILYIRSTG